MRRSLYVYLNRAPYLFFTFFYPLAGKGEFKGLLGKRRSKTCKEGDPSRGRLNICNQGICGRELIGAIRNLWGDYSPENPFGRVLWGYPGI
jgi:hypothetical protein